jgi:hypothetical protein
MKRETRTFAGAAETGVAVASFYPDVTLNGTVNLDSRCRDSLRAKAPRNRPPTLKIKPLCKPPGRHADRNRSRQSLSRPGPHGFGVRSKL